MRNRLGVRKAAAIAVSGLMALMVVGVTPVAATSIHTATINGCYLKVPGQFGLFGFVRVLTLPGDHCNAAVETAITFGGVGPTGPTGPTGGTGASGGTGGTGGTGASGSGGTGGTGGTGGIGLQGVSGGTGASGGTGGIGLQGVSGGTGGSGGSGGTGGIGLQGVSGGTGGSGGTGLQGASGGTGGSGLQGETGGTGASGGTGAAGSGGGTIHRRITDPAANGGASTDVNIAGCTQLSAGTTDSGGETFTTDNSGKSFVVKDQYAGCTGHFEVYAYCQAGETVIGGGVTWTGENGPNYSNGGDVEIAQSWPDTVGGPLDVWRTSLVSMLGVTHIDVTGYAICMGP